MTRQRQSAILCELYEDLRTETVVRFDKSHTGFYTLSEVIIKANYTGEDCLTAKLL